MKILQADKSTEKVGLREKVAYGFGDAAFSMFWKLFTMYLLFFYTDVVGIGAAVVGTMIFVTRFWDAFLDVGIGIMTDRTKSRWGMFRPYLLWGAIPFGLVGVLTFTAPELSATGKIVYAYISYSLMMVVYSLLNVPYASLLGVMTPDSKVRTQLSSFLMIFAFIGSIVVSLLVEPLVELFSKWNVSGTEVNLKFGWQMSAIVFSILAVVLLLLCFAWTKERVKPIKQAKNPIKTDLKDLLINKPWWILLGASISTLMFNSIRDGVAVYFFKYNVVETHLFHISFMNTNLALITVYLVLGQAANIVGILLTSPVSNKIGKRATFFAAMAIATVFSVLFYFLDYSNIPLILVFQFIISICAGAVTPLLWSMYADIADYSEWKTGRRATGLIFSASSMSQKLGGALGVAVVGWLLAYFGYVSGAEQSAHTQTGIQMMMSIFPAIATFVSAGFMFFYNITESKLKEISVELDASRQNEEE